MRLRGFDYKRPFFYMVTLKRLPGLADFSRISEEAEPPKDAQGKPCCLVANGIARAFEETIRHFHEHWWGLWPLECFAIMPDHIHLLFRLRDTGDQLPLGKYVYHLVKELAGVYWRRTGLPPQKGRPQTGSFSTYSIVLPKDRPQKHKKPIDSCKGRIFLCFLMILG